MGLLYLFTYIYIYIYIYISDCIETVYELPLLPNNTFIQLHKLGVAKSWLDIYHWDARLAVNG